MLRLLLCLLVLTTAWGFLLDNNNPMQAYLTTGDQSRKLSVESNVNIGSASGPKISVNRNSRFQTMDGFGAALTNSAAYVIYHSRQRHDIMRSLFGWTGIGKNIYFLN